MDEAAPGAPARLRARDLASSTPATRNRYVDLIRVVSIFVVVLGHWLMAVLGYRDGAFTGENLLELNPDLQWLTWIFQVMPLFFIVGGFSNAPSWISARARGTSYADWLRGRCGRLLRPAIWFVAFWTILPFAAVAVGLLPSGMARIGGEEVALPLWFLGVYILAVAAIPPLLAAHERYGVRLLIALAFAALLIDNLHFGLEVPVVGALNYAFVWLAIIELGFLWRDGVLGRRSWIPWAMAGGGLAVLGILVGFFDFPISMIGLTHAPRSNVQPPTTALLALAVWQCGAVLIFEDAANRWLERPRVWVAVVAANSMVMTFYLWNMSAVVLAAVLVFPTGVAPQPEALSTAWWLLRPAWILLCVLCLLPFLLGFRWAERPASPPPPGLRGVPGAALAVIGAATAAAGLAVLAANAFPVPHEDLLIPAVGVALVAVATLALHVDPVAPLRDG